MRTFLLASAAALAIGMSAGLTSCQSHYEVTSAQVKRIPIDSSITADAAAARLIEPYRAGVDSMMHTVLGRADMAMDRTRPECLLGNLVAEVLRLSAAKVTGQPADMSVMNVGGMRKDIVAGDITEADAFELLPFENSLCVLTMKGSAIKKVFGNLSARGGESISGARLTIDGKGGWSNATIGGQPVDDNRLYTVATIDYVAEGNDGMTGLLDFEDKVCPEGMTLRSLFIEYVRQQTAEGKTITSALDGRLKLER